MCGGGVGMQNIVHIYSYTQNLYSAYIQFHSYAYNNWKFRNS